MSAYDTNRCEKCSLPIFNSGGWAGFFPQFVFIISLNWYIYPVNSRISAVLSGHSLTLLESFNELSYFSTYLCIIIQWSAHVLPSAFIHHNLKSHISLKSQKRYIKQACFNISHGDLRWIKGGCGMRCQYQLAGGLRHSNDKSLASRMRFFHQTHQLQGWIASLNHPPLLVSSWLGGVSACAILAPMATR